MARPTDAASESAGTLPDWGVPVERTRARRPLPLVPAAVLIALVAVVGAIAGPVVGVAAALGLAAGGVAIARAAPARLLRKQGARRARRTEMPRLFNLVDGLSVDLRVAAPEVWVAEGPPNAVALDPGTPLVCLRRELVEGFTRTELEATVAFLLVGLATGAARRATFPRWAFPGRGEPDLGTLDVYAASVTRYPPALAAALSRSSPVAAPGLWFAAGDIERRAAALLDL